MNPIEKRIATAFAEVGTGEACTSLEYAERIASRCCIKGLTAQDVLLGQTPKGITAVWMHRRLSSNAVTEEQEAVSKSYPLLPFSRLVHEAIHKDAEAANCWWFPILLRTREGEVDAERLSAALEWAIGNHPVFAMHITEDGLQQHEKGFRTPYLKARVYSEDGYVYLSLVLNRILGDATSLVLFAQNIWRAYRGEELPHDGYLHYLEQYQKHTQTAAYQEHGRWLAEQYGNPSYPLLPRQDSPEGMLSTNGAHPTYIFQPDYASKLSDFSQRERISVNSFFCLAASLAIMEYNHTDEAGLTWAYMGRETPEHMHIFGSLHRDVPFSITKTRGEAFRQVREQIEQGIIHSDYPFTLLSPADSPWHNAVNVLVQPSLAEAMEGCPAAFEPVPAERSGESYCMLDIEINLEPLTLTFNYSPRHYTEASIRHFANLIDKNARLLLEQ